MKNLDVGSILRSRDLSFSLILHLHHLKFKTKMIDGNGILASIVLQNTYGDQVIIGTQKLYILILNFSIKLFLYLNVILCMQMFSSVWLSLPVRKDWVK